MPTVRSLAELKDRLAACCRAELDRQLRGKLGIKGQLLDEERRRLLRRPEQAFEARRIVTTRANSPSLVRFDRNECLLPVAWANHPLTVVGGIETVRVLTSGEVVAKHPRD